MLGAAITFALIVCMIVPLVLVLGFGGLGDTATIRIYGVALIVDTAILVGGGAAAIYAAVRAGRGDIVTLPLITPLAEQLFRPRRR